MSKAIYEVVTRSKTIPIRFPLGAASFGILRQEVDIMATEFDEIKAISIGVDSYQETSQTELQQFA